MLRSTVKALLLTASVAQADPLWKLFQEFKSKFNIEFESLEEDTARFGIFKRNMETAASLTKKSGGKAQFGPTKFSHLTTQEFKARYLGFKPANNRQELRKDWKRKVFGSSKKTVAQLKASTKDWRGTGAVTPVKDQGQCGSCWAFSATQAAETGYYMNTLSQKILAPQQTTSCDSEDGGCNGGDTVTAYDYMRSAGGLETEANYPYTSGDTEETGTCKVNSSDFVVKVGDTTIISESQDGEDSMLETIQDTPMSICVDAESWQFYFGGVVDSSTCGTSLDHCVHLVGYKGGEDDYWIVKNSWNTNWGEAGYIYVKQGENACGIALEATTVEASDEWSKLSKKSLAAPSPKTAIQIIEGVANGLGIDMADDCIDAGEDLVLKFIDAYGKITKKDAIDMAEAMRMIAIALQKDMPRALKSCKASGAEIAKLAKALAIIEHPKEFAYHVGHDLEVNGVDIYKEINASVGFYKSEKYEKMGQAIGKALSLLLIGSDSGVMKKESLYV